MNHTIRQFRSLQSDHQRREEQEQDTFEAWVIAICVILAVCALIGFAGAR